MDIMVEEVVRKDNLRASVWFWSVVGLFTTLWVLLPTLLHTSYCGDVIEVQNIGPEWVWATKKHPMLPAWILETLNILTCRSFAVPFIATQVCTLLALWSVWRLARTVLDERLALVAAFSVLPYLFFTCKPIWFNQNNVLIAFWALSIYFVFQAVQTNQKRYWITAGVALGLAFHAKYPTLFLCIAIVIYMLTQENGRKYFRTPGPWITILIVFTIFLPHIIWLFHHDFVTFQYASNRVPMLQWLSPLGFIGGQLLYWLLTLVILIPVIGFAWQWKSRHPEQGKTRECQSFLLFCAVIPAALLVLYGGIQGKYIPMEYGAPLWTFGGLWLLLRFQTKEPIQCFHQAVTLTITIMFFIAAGFATEFYLGLQHPKHYRPMHALGTVCEQLWCSHVSNAQCPYIAGDDLLLVGHVAHAMPLRPSVIMPQGTWADDSDLNNKGGMIVWEIKNGERAMPESLHSRFSKAKVLLETPELPYKVGNKVLTLKLGIAIVPPSAGQ